MQTYKIGDNLFCEMNSMLKCFNFFFSFLIRYFLQITFSSLKNIFYFALTPAYRFLWHKFSISIVILDLLVQTIESIEKALCVYAYGFNWKVWNFKWNAISKQEKKKLRLTFISFPTHPIVILRRMIVNEAN